MIIQTAPERGKGKTGPRYDGWFVRESGGQENELAKWVERRSLKSGQIGKMGGLREIR